ncbi:class I adenylate-forming enzyme family protein, partial [Gordonia sp. i37]|uniref:class I adenylate-forming enzyme family protein n=1 Tax=Gordonia sp. i37 TaxID=1961707 RepID=UPI0009CD9A45
MSVAPTETAPRALTQAQTAPLGRATIGDQLRRLARSQPIKPAIVSYLSDGTRSATTYEELDRLSNRFAHALLARGVRRGDGVAVMGRNRVENVIAYYGALKVGAFYSGISPLFGEREIAYQIQHLEPAVLVVATESAELAAPIADAAGARVIVIGESPDPAWTSFESALAEGQDDQPAVDVDEHDIAMIVYTSGTESTPKGVVIAHRNYLISTAPAYTWGLRCLPDDVWLY